MRKILTTLILTLTAIGAGAVPGPKINGNQISTGTAISISTLNVTGAQGLIVVTTETIQGNAFSVGASTFVVKAGSVGVGGTPGGAANLEVFGSAQFGSGAVKSTATAAGGLNVGGAFAVGGSTFVVSAGSVAIGASAPTSAANLWVNGSAQFGTGVNQSTFTAAGALNVPGTITGNSLISTNGQYNGASGADTYLIASGGGGGSVQIRLETSAGGHIYMGPNGGNVGINQLNPVATLDVVAAGSAANYGIAFPQMTTTQVRNTTPSKVGMVIWNSTLAALCVSTGAATNEAYGLVSSPTTKCE